MQHETAKSKSLPSGKKLYCRVRANLVSNGTSFAEWCRKNAISRQYATKILKHKSNGAKALALKRKILRATIQRDNKL